MSKKTCSLRSSSSELHLEITPPPTCVYSETGREEQLIDLKGQAPGDRKFSANSGSGEIVCVANGRRTRAASRVQEGFAIEEIGRASCRESVESCGEVR